jgi:hypothetical protein
VSLICLSLICYAECHDAEYRYYERHYSECHYAKYCCTDSRGAPNLIERESKKNLPYRSGQAYFLNVAFLRFIHKSNKKIRNILEFEFFRKKRCHDNNEAPAG